MNSEVETGQETSATVPHRYWLVAFCVFLLLAVGLAYLLPQQTASQQFYFRVFIALAASGIASIIPGFLSIRLNWLQNSIRAGGAIGIFLLLFFWNPPKFEDGDRVQISIDGKWEFFLDSDVESVKVGNASIEHSEGSPVFKITGNVPTNPAAPPGKIVTPLITFESNFAVITPQRIVFHYRNNVDEEGVASADYAGTSPEELLFNFRDYAETDKDGLRAGVLRFKRIIK